ncbi:MAG: hypothetical protein CSA81_07310 [Acidobacteria bacterium]|nr:MAG: hypothetical protein CSA81_07310 [Acidobacteriota bacterium]
MIMSLKLKRKYQSSMLQYRPADSVPRGTDLSKLKQWLFLFKLAESNHVLKPNCLRSSLALRSLLSKRGFETELQIGAHIEKEEGLDAHAWLEYHGEVVYGDLPDLNKYAVFPKFRS